MNYSRTRWNNWGRLKHVSNNHNNYINKKLNNSVRYWKSNLMRRIIHSPNNTQSWVNVPRITEIYKKCGSVPFWLTSFYSTNIAYGNPTRILDFDLKNLLSLTAITAVTSKQLRDNDRIKKPAGTQYIMAHPGDNHKHKLYTLYGQCTCYYFFISVKLE